MSSAIRCFLGTCVTPCRRILISTLSALLYPMAPASQLSTLSNPLVSVEQLSNSSSQLDGVSVDLEHSIRYAGAQLTQAAGVLLRLPQEIIAQAIITLNRFYIGPEGGSVRTHAVQVRKSHAARSGEELIAAFAGCLSSICVPCVQDFSSSTISSIRFECLRLSSFLGFSPLSSSHFGYSARKP